MYSFKNKVDFNNFILILVENENEKNFYVPSGLPDLCE